jgi:hypothetical protein
MRWQSVHDQMHRLLSIEHQLLEQRDEQLAAEPAFVRCKPEGTLRIDGGRRANALPLARPLDNRRFAARRPGLAMHRVSSKARFVPAENIRLLLMSLLGKGRIRVVSPAIDCLRIALVSPPQRLLRRQVQACQRGFCANRMTEHREPSSST